MTPIQERIHSVETHLRESDEFPALLEKIVEKAQSEPSPRKRHLLAVGFANILVAGTTQPYDTKISLLDTLDSLTEADLRVLANFAREGRIRIDKLIPTSQEYRDENGLGETASDLIVSLCKLESRGLIGETTPVNQNFDAPGEVTHWVNRWRRRAFQLIPFGRTLLDTIREPEPPSQALNLQKI